MENLQEIQLTEIAKETLNSDYRTPKVKNGSMDGYQESINEIFWRACYAYASNEDHAKRLYSYIAKDWFRPSSPILANGGKTTGNPISCFLNYIPDSREGLAQYWRENVFLASGGGGIGSYAGDLRSAGTWTSHGNQTSGIIPFLNVTDSLTVAISQGRTRRGATAIYLDISHPEIEEFIDIRKFKGADPYRKTPSLHHAVNITDKFMQAVLEDDTFPLIDPHTKEVKKTISAKTLWKKILQTRIETGEPYLHFIDTTNKNLPHWLKSKGLYVRNSNLCSEITLPTTEDRTAVCCLSSVNVEYFDEWEHESLFILDIIEYLDNVLQSFIDTANLDEYAQAIHSAMRERSIGLGVMGLHAYFQKRGIPWSSIYAKGRNKYIFKHIQQEALAADTHLCSLRGEAPDAIGQGRRFSHLIAIAPTARISLLCNGTSPGVEPYLANAYTINLKVGTFKQRNKFLVKLLEDKNLSDKELKTFWSQVVANEGSVQGNLFLTPEEQDVFKTAREIDQLDIINLAADRQPYICQAQSINLFFTEDAPPVYIHNVHLQAWKQGLKTLYYLKSKKLKSAEAISQKVEQYKRDPDTCIMCDG